VPAKPLLHSEAEYFVFTSQLKLAAENNNNNNNYYYYYYIIYFVHGIHTYIPETNHVSRVYRVAAIPRLLFMVHITLSSILNSFVLLH
jgi:hypothetical protein